jgi:hypothetical protein
VLAQLVNQDFLVDAAEDTRVELNRLAGQVGRRGAADAGLGEEITAEDLREVAERLRTAVDELEGDREDPSRASWICMPRDPLLSILQTELEAAIADQAPGAVESDPLAPVDRRIAEDPGERTAQGRRAFGAFEVTRPKVLSDPKWVWSGVVIAWHAFKNKAPFGGLPSQAIGIADDARVLLVGDWGSGIARAQAVAAEMRKELDRGIADGREQHVVHLGDVYYTGADDEYRERFLPYWPVREGEDIGSWTLVGNHDMYRGGHGYYAAGLTDPRFVRQEGRSVFALRSPSWQLLGLDTGYEDAALYGDQDEWIRRQREEGGDRRTALLTHHQYFSAYEDAGQKLRPKLQPILDDRAVDAWFWAHEHRCLTYEPCDGIGFASCVGHGGIPEYLVAAEGVPYPPAGDPYPAALRYDFRERHGDGLEPWNTFGFAVLELAGRTMTVRYVDEHGHEHRKEVLSA